ncbi:tRNA pseudouridine38-40 synthase [Nematocida sp. AWRm77]|nr:tRNA pseudouridine38-40 synthase [Nematocida sp. AWRm77]
MGKKRIIILIGYNGHGYKGSQINKEERTIEKEVCDEIAGLGYFKESNCEDYSKVGLQRSSRTDKGVHAAMQVLSVKIETGGERSVEKLEKNLKEALKDTQIEVHRIIGVPKGFDAKNRCESRVYEYFVPKSAYTLSTDTKDVKERRLEVLKEVFRRMQGTHDFHNFTLQSQEKGTSRYIKDINAEEVPEHGGEWHRVQIHGQSFMIHQIRKMIGFAVLVACRMDAGVLLDKDSASKQSSLIDEYMQRVFGSEKRNIPKAPGSLLLLSHSLFTNYNEKFGNTHGVIDHSLYSTYKEKTLYPLMCTEENKEAFAQWHEMLDMHKEEFSYMDVSHEA